MAPSLTEIFNGRYPPGTRDGLADEEDLTSSELTLKGNGIKVKVVKVDVVKGTHIVKFPDKVKVEFLNDQDVYVETS